MKLNDTQKDYLQIGFCLTLFWLFIGYFVFTQPNHLVEHKAPPVEKEHVQPPVLEHYGKILTKNFARWNQN